MSMNVFQRVLTKSPFPKLRVRNSLNVKRLYLLMRGMIIVICSNRYRTKDLAHNMQAHNSTSRAGSRGGRKGRTPTLFW